MKKNLTLLFFVILILTFLSEIFIRFFFPQDLQRYWVFYEPTHGLPINKKNYTHKLHRFKSHKATYTFGRYHNRETIRNFDILNKKKILVLGESFTFGWLIDDKNTLIHKFQKENLDYHFINVAVGAWGSAHYTLFTELFCKQIKPEKIIIILNTDDFHRGYKSGFYKKKNDALVRIKKEFKNIEGDSEFDKKIPFYKFLKSNSHLFMLTRNTVYNLIYKPKYNPWSEERYWPRPNGKFDLEYSKNVLELNQKIFLRLKKNSEECNSSLNILNISWANHQLMEDTNPNKLFLKSAKSFFENNNINYFENNDKMSDLYSNPMKYIIDVDFHPNKKGVDLIYSNLRNQIKKILSK